MDIKEVFISYKAEEFDEANWVKTVLEENGITCWMAPMCITGGASYAEEIPQAIRNCKVFVLILSEKCQLSKWVPRELDQAINESKIIMPFMLENCKLKDDFNFYLSNVQRYAAYENKANAIGKMIREIKGILGHKENEDTPVTPAPVKAQPQKDKKDKVDVVIIKKEKAKEGKNKKRPLLIAGAAVLAVVLLIVGGILIKRANQLVIAGERVNKNENFLSIDDMDLTAQDIANIGQLKNLSYIALEGCSLPDGELTFLGNSELTTIWLVDCGLKTEHLSCIDFENMTDLSTLNIRDNSGVTLPEGMEHLADTLLYLDISNTGVSDVAFLEGFTELIYLAADGNGIKDLSMLASSVDLETVSVNRNQLTSLKGLENCIVMQEIFASSNQISSWEGLENMTILEKVNLNHNQLRDLKGLLKSVATLQELYVKNNQISSLSEIEDCIEMQYLDIDNNKVTGLDSLSGMTKLEAISMSGNQISQLDGIENCKALIYIDASNNKLTSTGVLGELPLDYQYGVFVDLSNNQISSLQYMPKGVDYNYLDLHGNKITSLEEVTGSEGSKIIFDYDENIDITRLAEGSFFTYRILNCPLDKQVGVKSILGEYSTEYVTEEDIATLKEEHVWDIFKEE